MSDKRVIVVHPDGRRYSVTLAAFRDLYEPHGFTVEGPETGAAFSGALGRAETPARPRKRHPYRARRA